GGGTADENAVDAGGVDRVEVEPHDGAHDGNDAIGEVAVDRRPPRVALGIVADVEALPRIRRRRRGRDGVSIAADLARYDARVRVLPARKAVAGAAPVETHVAEPRVR